MNDKEKKEKLEEMIKGKPVYDENGELTQETQPSVVSVEDARILFGLDVGDQ